MKFDIVGILSGNREKVIASFYEHEEAVKFALKVDMKHGGFDDVVVRESDAAHKAVTTAPDTTGKNIVVAPPANRSSVGLRDALFDEIDAFRSGQGDPSRAVAISKLAHQILSSAKLEHEVAKYKASENYDSSSLQLGGHKDD